MSDARLRELERRWRETSAVEDEVPWQLARVRAGDLAPGDVAALEQALVPAPGSDLRELEAALVAATREDPLLRWRRDGLRDACVLGGPSVGILAAACVRLAAAAPDGAPRVAFRQVVRGRCQAARSVMRQAQCPGQYASIALEVEEDAAADPLTFDDQSDLSAVWVDVVQSTLRRLAAEGLDTGVPVRGLRVVLRRGREHPVDSHEPSFFVATRLAWEDALGKLERTLLEPRVHVVGRSTQREDLPRAAAGLGTLGASVTSCEADALEGELPLSLVGEAAVALEHAFGGRVRLSIGPVRRFAPVPAARASEVLEARRRERAYAETWR